MSNKAKRNLSLLMMIIGLTTLIGLALSRKFFGIQHDMWQYIAAPLWICFFGVLYRNFSLAVKEDKKYGPMK
ncbi:MAG: hypothetical protein J6L73_02585 [Muribaculaceae bacterium]|nr:hypothetical protein [Muribaculaceae bacterium]